MGFYSYVLAIWSFPLYLLTRAIVFVLLYRRDAARMAALLPPQAPATKPAASLARLRAWYIALWLPWIALVALNYRYATSERYGLSIAVLSILLWALFLYFDIAFLASSFYSRTVLKRVLISALVIPIFMVMTVFGPHEPKTGPDDLIIIPYATAPGVPMEDYLFSYFTRREEVRQEARSILHQSYRLSFAEQYTKYGSSLRITPNLIALLPDGRTVLEAAMGDDSGNSDSRIERYRADGTPDPTVNDHALDFPSDEDDLYLHPHNIAFIEPRSGNFFGEGNNTPWQAVAVDGLDRMNLDPFLDLGDSDPVKLDPRAAQLRTDPWRFSAFVSLQGASEYALLVYPLRADDPPGKSARCALLSFATFPLTVAKPPVMFDCEKGWKTEAVYAGDSAMEILAKLGGGQAVVYLDRAGHVIKQLPVDAVDATIELNNPTFLDATHIVFGYQNGVGTYALGELREANGSYAMDEAFARNIAQSMGSFTAQPLFFIGSGKVLAAGAEGSNLRFALLRADGSLAVRIY